MSVVSALVHSHHSQVYKKHATEKTGTNSREKDEEGGSRGRGGRRKSRKGGEGENIETVDHENRTPGSRWAETRMHHI